MAPTKSQILTASGLVPALVPLGSTCVPKGPNLRYLQPSAMVPALVPFGSTRFHMVARRPKSQILTVFYHGSGFGSIWFRLWFHLVPPGSAWLP